MIHPFLEDIDFSKHLLAGYTEFSPIFPKSPFLPSNPITNVYFQFFFLSGHGPLVIDCSLLPHRFCCSASLDCLKIFLAFWGNRDIPAVLQPMWSLSDTGVTFLITLQ